MALEIMKLLGSRILVTILATLTAVIFIIFSNLYPDKSIIFLSIEVILLPAIYIIGNYCAENSIKKEYEYLMKDLTIKTERLQDDLDKEKMENVELRTILDINFGFEENDNKKK